MRHLQPHGEPHLARWGMRRGALGRAAGRLVAFEARHPPIHRGPSALQALTDTALTPALRLEGEAFQAGVGALGRAGGGEERPRGRGRRREAFPEALRRVAGEAIHGGMQHAPGAGAAPAPLGEAFAPLEFMPDRGGPPEWAMGRADVQGIGPEPAPPLLRQAACEAAPRFRMGPGCLRPLRRGTLGQEQQRADECIPLEH